MSPCHQNFPNADGFPNRCTVYPSYYGVYTVFSSKDGECCIQIFRFMFAAEPQTGRLVKIEISLPWMRYLTRVDHGM